MESVNSAKQMWDRRSFIGGSDARIIMGDDQTALTRLWREKRGELEPEDLSQNLIVQLGTISSCSSVPSLRTSTARGTSATPATRSRTSKGGSATLSTNGWQRRWMAWCNRPGPCSNPSSCCLGIFPRKLRPRSTWPSSSTICGWRQQSQQCFRSLPGAANGWRSRCMPTRSTNISF